MSLSATQIAAVGARPLEGRVAIVTGSTRGVGLGIAESLAEQGASLVLNGFGDPAEIEQTRETLAVLHGVEVRYAAADLSVPGQVCAMVAFARDVAGPIDILVNTAALQHTAPVGEFPTLQWDAILAVNLSAAFHAIKCVLPQMVERGSGRIVNIASVHGLVGAPMKSACVAARHGLVGLTKTVALETAQSGVTCNAICPGLVRASLAEAAAEIGALTAFLCGDAAASITGAALAVDGGWTAQ